MIERQLKNCFLPVKRVNFFCPLSFARTLVVCGKILLPGDHELAKTAWQVWRKSQILSRGLLEEAELLKTKDMLMVESVGDDSLPGTTDSSTHVNPPEKSQQIGVSAGQCILRGFFNSTPDDGERRAQVIIDLTVHTADITRAFIHERLAKAFGSPCYYLGFAANDDHLEWCQHILSEYMVEGFLQERLSMPTGAVLPPATMPADQVQAVPPAPSLNLLTINNKVKIDQLPTLKCPDKLLATWHDHNRFGSEFRQVVDAARKDLLLDVPADKGDQETTSRKRGGPNGGSEPLPVPVGKVVKTGQVAEVAGGTVIKVDDLPTPLRYEGALPKKGPAVVITIGQKIFLVNRSNQDQVVSVGTTLAGFFKGMWWHKKKNSDPSNQKAKAKAGSETPQEVKPEKDVLFELLDSTSVVQVGGSVQTVAQIVAEKQKTTTSCKIAYHEMKETWPFSILCFVLLFFFNRKEDSKSCLAGPMIGQ